ncbi:carbohydrate-selective porin OprB [Burkholderia multivorans]|nr:carbohydrate-selective porin OprB [Burkholderia multivorans]
MLSILSSWSGVCLSAPAEPVQSVVENNVTGIPVYNSEGVPAVKGPRPESASGPLMNLGDALAAHGINYQGFFLAGYFNNLSTGARPGHGGYQGLFINSVDLDLDKMLSVPKAKIHTEVTLFPFSSQRGNTFFGNYASSYLGTDQFPSHTTGAPWLSLLTYEQTVLNDKLNFEVGKSTLVRYFFLPNCGVDFECTDVGVKWTTRDPDPSVGMPTARVRYDATPHFSIEAGVQQLRGYSAVVRQNGWDFASYSDGEGALLVGGVGYHSDFSTERLPSVYSLDYFYSNSRVQDPYYSVNGNSVVLTGEQAQSHVGSGGIVFKMQKTLWADQDGLLPDVRAVPRNLTFFSTFVRSFDTARAVGWAFTGGLTLTDPFKRRWNWFSVDQFNVKTMYLRLNRSTLLAQRDSRMLLGGTSETTSPNEYRFEVSGTFSLGRYAKLQPVIEYILNPDGSQSGDSKRVPRSGWLAGATLAITFGNVNP